MSPGENSPEELKRWLAGVSADATLSDRELAKRLIWAQPEAYED